LEELVVLLSLKGQFLMKIYIGIHSLAFLIIFQVTLSAQKMPPSITESAREPIRYVGNKQTDPKYHHGGLRHAVGAHRYQAFRANREYPSEVGSPAGWTYNHQPYLCYWNDQFYLQYLSNQYTEHLTPGRTMLMTSSNGRDWSSPEIIFPEYTLPQIDYVDPESRKTYVIPEGTKAVMHQRMGFYISSNNRLLTLAFYSFCPTSRIGPNRGQGLGRVVREIYRDGTYGPIYFIRYNRHAGWDESNTNYPFYQESSDQGFIKSCDELLNNKLITLQWWEEDRGEDGFFAIVPGEYEPKAFNFYRRPDKVLVGIWKHQLTALSDNEGQSWTDFALSKSLMTCGAKIWGQQTEDGKYALVYNHSATRRNRWPLAVMTGEDGHEFNNLLCLHGEVPPMRYYGWAKNQGPQYVRGIIEGNGNPPGNHMWNVYSMSKEDIWICRTRVPISGIVQQHVNQDFDALDSEAELEWWNFHVPQWAPIDIITIPGTDNRVLQLSDEEPYDYACAERHFPPSSKATIEFSIMVKEQGKDILEFELHNENDERVLRLRFDVNLEGINLDLGRVEPAPLPFTMNRWYDIRLSFDCDKSSYDIWINGKKIRENIEFDINEPSLERIVFRTGSWRSDVRQFLLRGQPNGPGMDSENLPAAGEKVPRSVFWLDNVKTMEE
jgi:hypothetical protein